MDPLTAGIGVVSLGMQLFGGISASQDAGHAAEIQRNITGLELKANDQRQTAMEVNARRMKLENFRRNQQLSAQSTNNATQSNAQFGSGYEGGKAQVTSEGLFNDQGINQNLEIGRNIFSIDKQIGQQKIALAGVQSDIATDQSISNFGASLGKNAGTISNLYGYAKAQLPNPGGPYV